MSSWSRPWARPTWETESMDDAVDRESSVDLGVTAWYQCWHDLEAYHDE